MELLISKFCFRINNGRFSGIYLYLLQKELMYGFLFRVGQVGAIIGLNNLPPFPFRDDGVFSDGQLWRGAYPAKQY